MHVQAKQYLDVDEDSEETLKMADPALGGRYDAEQLRNMAWAATLCVHTSPHQRPPMSEVTNCEKPQQKVLFINLLYWLVEKV